MKRTMMLAGAAALSVVAILALRGARYGEVATGDRAIQVARQEFRRQGATPDGPWKVTHANGVWRVLAHYPTGRTGEVYIRDDGRIPSINPRKLKLIPVIANPPPDDEAFAETN